MMSLEPVCTVRLPVYKEFTNFAIWPAPHSVSNYQNRKPSEIWNKSRVTFRQPSKLIFGMQPNHNLTRRNMKKKIRVT